jgi:uncharacterized phage protein (predicted DNA packaging)
MTTLDSVKLALRISTAAFDAELNTLIQAALMDMGVAGVTESDETNALILRAVITYCKANFGEPDEYDRLKRSYDEQKAQLVTATGYTEWGEIDG